MELVILFSLEFEILTDLITTQLQIFLAKLAFSELTQR